MNNSLQRRNREEEVKTTLAPVIPLRSVRVEEKRESRKVSREEKEERLPLFYTKPIFKTKKYDLL
ncbi:MAG: hypothetical protein C4308_10675 [Chitinophagaceae bacterium]